VKYFDWNEEKNKLLKIEREIGFEDILIAIESGNSLDIVKHPKEQKYPGQKNFIVNINNYACLVPFTEDNKMIFLKTIIPSRKATKKYIVNKGSER